MNIYDKAHELSRAFRESPEFQEWKRLQAGIDADTGSKRMLDQFRGRQQALSQQIRTLFNAIVGLRGPINAYWTLPDTAYGTVINHTIWVGSVPQAIAIWKRTRSLRATSTLASCCAVSLIADHVMQAAFRKDQLRHGDEQLA